MFCSLTTSDTILIITAIIIFIVGYYTLRTQVVIALQNQLFLKAADCNKFIDSVSQGIDGNTQNISAIVSSILFGKELITNYFKVYWFLLLFVNKQLIIEDYFYLQLHTSVIEILKLDKLPAKVTDFREQIQDQLNRAKAFFEKSLLKYRNI